MFLINVNITILSADDKINFCSIIRPRREFQHALLCIETVEDSRFS